MPSPPSSEPKKIPQQLVFHFQPLDFIVLFLLCRYVSFSRPSPAPGKNSCFHFPYPPVIPFYPSFYHVFVFESELLRYFSICFPCRFHLQYLFLLLVRAYIALTYKSPPGVVIFLRQGAFVNVRFSWFCTHFTGGLLFLQQSVKLRGGFLFGVFRYIQYLRF